jgi:hypothetical protein
MLENASTPEKSPSSSWSDLFAELIRSFVLLRDVFGYILPGVLFLLIGAQSGHLPDFSGKVKLPDAYSHPWLFAISFLVISYILGHFIVATSYLYSNVKSLIDEKKRRTTERPFEKTAGEERKQHQEKIEKSNKDDQDAADFLRYHKDFPEIYIEHGRQSIMALLRRGLAAAFFLGLLVFCNFNAALPWVMILAGVSMLVSCFSGYYHVGRLKKHTLQSAKDAANLAKPRA